MNVQECVTLHESYTSKNSKHYLWLLICVNSSIPHSKRSSFIWFCPAFIRKKTEGQRKKFLNEVHTASECWISRRWAAESVLACTRTVIHKLVLLLNFSGILASV